MVVPPQLAPRSICPTALAGGDGGGCGGEGNWDVARPRTRCVCPPCCQSPGPPRSRVLGAMPFESPSAVGLLEPARWLRPLDEGRPEDGARREGRRVAIFRDDIIIDNLAHIASPPRCVHATTSPFTGDPSCSHRRLPPRRWVPNATPFIRNGGRAPTPCTRSSRTTADSGTQRRRRRGRHQGR
jgi:hypothetical protein